MRCSRLKVPWAVVAIVLACGCDTIGFSSIGPRGEAAADGPSTDTVGPDAGPAPDAGDVTADADLPIDGAVEPLAAVCDGLTPAPATDCAAAGTLFCDSFESGEFLSLWDWVCLGDNYQCDGPAPEVTAATTATQPCRGDSAAELATEGGPDTKQNAYLGVNLDLPATYYIRFYVLAPTGSNSTDHDVMIAFSDTTAPRLGFGANDGQLRIKALNESVSFDAGWSRDTWTCVEARMSADGADVWVNETLVHQYNGTLIAAGSAWTGVALGVTGSDPNGRTTLLLDEVAVSDSPIGCRALGLGD